MARSGFAVPWSRPIPGIDIPRSRRRTRMAGEMLANARAAKNSRPACRLAAAVAFGRLAGCQDNNDA